MNGEGLLKMSELAALEADGAIAGRATDDAVPPTTFLS